MPHCVGGRVAQPIQRASGAGARPQAATLAPSARPQQARPARKRAVVLCSSAPQRAASATAVREQAAPPAPRFDANNLPRGETAGATVVVDNVSLQAGDRDLMTDVEWRVMPGHRVGLVGANGCGKTTLLKALCGLRPVDGGRIVFAPTVSVGYLEQVGVAGSFRSVWDEAKSRMTHILDAEAAIDAAVRGVEAGEPRAAEALQEAQAAFEAAGGYDADKRIANVLAGLGFKQEEMQKPASEFSGGWQMRIALARTLLSPAGESSLSGGGGILLLVHEPTNHLDRKACNWLADFLRSSTGTVIIVSHDEAMLETCNRITEVRGGKLNHFTGNYSDFLAMRKLREEQAYAQAMAAQVEIARTEAYIARFGAKTAFASQAKSREKALNKMRENLGELPAAASSAGGGDRTKSSMRFLPPPPCHREMIVLKGAIVGWADKPLLSSVNLTVEKGQRILMLGPNGAGKSTFLKAALAGTEPLLGGTRRLGEGVKLAVFSQDLAQDLPLEMPALDYVLKKARKDDPNITTEMGRKSLGSLGLTGDGAQRPIGQLSGGEKARVALAAFALIPYNLLLLDEPTNHLDVSTIDAVTAALQVFEGAVVAITHNKMFASRLNAKHVLRIEAGRATLKPNIDGLSDADFEETQPSAPVAGAPRKTPKKARAPSPEEELEAMRAAARQERFALAGNTAAMAEADAKPKSKNERMAAKREAENAAKAAKQEAKKRVPKGQR